MNLRYFNSNIIRKRLFVALVIVVLLYIFFFYRTKKENCFANGKSDGLTLPDVSDNKILIQHKSSKNIFFHETSCNPGKSLIEKIIFEDPVNKFFLAGIIALTPRAACAIESAGKKLSRDI